MSFYKLYRDSSPVLEVVYSYFSQKFSVLVFRSNNVRTKESKSVFNYKPVFLCSGLGIWTFIPKYKWDVYNPSCPIFTANMNDAWSMCLVPVWWWHLLYVADISEIESYRSYSPQEDRRSHHSDLSSHSSNERLQEKNR